MKDDELEEEVDGKKKIDILGEEIDEESIDIDEEDELFDSEGYLIEEETTEKIPGEEEEEDPWSIDGVEGHNDDEL